MRKYLRLLAAVLVIGAAALALLYTRPLTVPEICPAIDFQQCSRIHGYYYLYDGSNGAGEDQSFELTADDAEFTALLASVKEREFRRSLLSLLPSGGRSHRLEDGDYKWSVIFTFNDLSFPDGSVGRGDILHIDNFFGELSLYHDGVKLYCSTDDQDTWIAQIMKYISAKEA